MPDFEKIAKTSEIPPGTGNCFTVGEKLIGVFNINGEFHAINDLCPHMGASLSAGHFEEDTVCCPWHAWRFRVTDGTWCDNPKLKIDRYEIKVDGDDIWVSTSKIADETEQGKDAPDTNDNGKNSGDCQLPNS